MRAFGNLTKNHTISLGVSLVVAFIILIAAIVLTNGNQLYSLDDPYIHLQLAKMMGQGTYGFWPGEPSAPASSILWPVLMMPFAAMSFGIIWPMVINFLCLAFSVIVLTDYFAEIFPSEGDQPNLKTIFATLGTVLLANLVGLVFTGMEHPLHCLLVIVVFHQLTRIQRGLDASKLLVPCLILLPLIRYEGLVLTCFACLYLWLKSQRKPAVLSFACAIAGLLAFSGFLASQNLGIFPSSVMSKSTKAVAIAEKISPTNIQPYDVDSSSVHPAPVRTDPNQAKIEVKLFNLFRNTRIQFGLFVILSIFLCIQKDRKSNLLFWPLFGTIIGHFGVGKIDWFHRYEMYVYLIAIMGIIYLQNQNPRFSIRPVTKKSHHFALLILGAWFTMNSVIALVYTPLAARSIYEQQFQMMRFVRDYYKKPVAINDIGIVGYASNQRVFDLVGLASREALIRNQQDPKHFWIGPGVAEQNIGLVIIYDNWFRSLPNSWTKVATLKLGHPKVAIAEDQVSFFITPQTDDSQKVIEDLKAFQSTLPKGVILDLDPRE